MWSIHSEIPNDLNNGVGNPNRKKKAKCQNLNIDPQVLFCYFLLLHACWKTKYDVHSAEKVFNSDWSINSFIIVVYDNFFSSVRIFCPKPDYKILIDNHLKLFTDQSEMSALPAGRSGKIKEKKHLDIIILWIFVHFYTPVLDIKWRKSGLIKFTRISCL